MPVKVLPFKFQGKNFDPNGIFKLSCFWQDFKMIKTPRLNTDVFEHVISVLFYLSISPIRCEKYVLIVGT